MHNENPIRNYKDTVFRMIFKEKPQLLSLYNAINKTEYEDPGELEITTLENAVYMTMKNDVSCLLDMRLQLYEQQSTYTPNMPLRFLLYLASQFEKLIIKKDMYSSKLILLPTPKCIVFYNGVTEQPEEKTLHLSDSYVKRAHGEERYSLELEVLQLNINKGYNEDLKSRCSLLFEYMEYVDRVRKNMQTMPIEPAVQTAVDSCIADDILRDFLLKNKAEVVRMSIFEYDEELHTKTLREEGYEEGYEEGIECGVERGIERGRSETVLELYRAGSITEEVAIQTIGCTMEAFREMTQNN